MYWPTYANPVGYTMVACPTIPSSFHVIHGGLGSAPQLRFDSMELLPFANFAPSLVAEDLPGHGGDDVL